MTHDVAAKITPKADRKQPVAFVVNDTQEILDLFREILEEEGFEVVLSTFAPRDLDELIAVDPDLVILDFMIGYESFGWQLLQKMKMHRETDDIPTVVCTGAVQLARELEGHLTSKSVGVVLKPFDIDDLLLTVSATIDLSPRASGNYVAAHRSAGEDAS